MHYTFTFSVTVPDDMEAGDIATIIAEAIDNAGIEASALELISTE